MKKVFISFPMHKLPTEEIAKIRNELGIKAAEIIEDDIEVLDNNFDFGDKSHLYYLAKSLELMSEADIVYFAEGWEKSRGCRIEHECAVKYELDYIALCDYGYINICINRNNKLEGD